MSYEGLAWHDDDRGVTYMRGPQAIATGSGHDRVSALYNLWTILVEAGDEGELAAWIGDKHRVLKALTDKQKGGA